MTDRIGIIDRIRRELLRQANRNGPLNFSVMPTGEPDTFYVHGKLDVDALAKAVRNE